MAIINNLNGDKVEFTGVSRVWNNTKYDFEEIYFGDKQIFSIWAELESPLPITILAAGEDLIDYRIFGNTENGESVGERTENLLGKDLTKFLNYMVLTANGNETGNDFYCVSDYIPILPGTVYSVLSPNNGFGAYHCFYDSNKDFLMSFPANGQGLQTATSPPNASYIKCTLLSYTRYPDAFASTMLFEGSTAPTSYIPYGYQLPMVAFSSELKEVGDQVLVDGEPWDIVDYNNERTIATLCKKTLSIAVPFSSKEALFAFPNGLAAGTYHFTMPKTAWYLLPQDSEKNIEFTLTNDIPPNGQLVVTPTGNTLISGTISCYTSPTSTIATETAKLSEGTGGTELESPSFTDDPTGNVNSILCGVNGTTVYKSSPLRQLLNSSASAGNVWTPANKFDRPPTWASSIDGFMHDMDVNFINAMASINFVTASGQNASYQLNDKIFLPSYTEISGTANYDVYEGNQYQFYVDADANKRKKYTSDNVSRTWHLRSIGPYSIGNARFVTQNGNYDYGSPTASYYISPACHIDLTQSENPWIKSNMYKSTTTTPIYIGSDPLAEDEYVDFGEQKVYKRTSNLFDIRKVASNIVTITGDNEFQKAETEEFWYDLFDHQTSDSPRRNADTTKCLYLEAGTYTLSGTAKLPDDDYADLGYVLTAQSNGTILAATALPYTFTLAADNYITIRIGTTHRVNMSQIMITAGSETPSTYESYLMPTDPPVPISALPTIEGETIIDYNPSTTPAVEPEKMYTKYRKEGF